MADAVKETKANGAAKNISRFFSELKAELKRITWPTRQELISNTISVLVSCVIVGVFIAIVDAVLAKVLEYFIVR